MALRKQGGSTWLVGHDFSPLSERAAEVAVEELAHLRGGRLVLLHVFTVLMPMNAMEPRSVQFAAAEYAARVAAEAKLRIEAERLRRRAAELVRGGAAHVEVEHVAREGLAADVIAREATAWGADRVVVGTRGRTGLARVVWGSVAESVVRKSPVPTLVTRIGTRAVADQERRPAAH